MASLQRTRMSTLALGDFRALPLRFLFEQPAEAPQLAETDYRCWDFGRKAMAKFAKMIGWVQLNAWVIG
jgi:hypothetical protein